MSERYDYSRADVVRAAKTVGIQHGDILFLHVGTGFLGRVQFAGGTTFEREQSFKDVFDAVHGGLRDVVGPEGTLVVPTYTYSFCRGEVYDPEATPSATGPFTEGFRAFPEAVRSVDPIFSVAVMGPAATALVKDVPSDCFGEDCIYDRLMKQDASICTIGVGFRYATFVHFVEERMAVPYRFKKTFSGTIMENGISRVANAEYFVRTVVDDEATFPDLNRLERDAIDAGVLHSTPLGRGRITRIRCRDLYQLAAEGIQKDPWYLARGGRKADTEPSIKI